jgi:hypothetical protein
MSEYARKKLTGAELEAAIMERLEKHPECAAITQVYVKSTGAEPPEVTWVHGLVSRRPTSPRNLDETSKLQQVLSKMQKEYELVAD